MSINIPWSDLADVHGFIGNSLLKPMTQTADAGIDPGFWASFPDFGDASIREAIARCRRFAEQAASHVSNGEDVVLRVSVEYTSLFIGPPSPAAPPWETMYRSDHATVGFGNPTFEMRRILRESGLELSNENNQYEDHMGIELLYLSTQCASSWLAAGGEPREASGAADSNALAVLGFIAGHPLDWIGGFRERIAQTHPDGYFAVLLGLAESVLTWHANVLRTRD